MGCMVCGAPAALQKGWPDFFEHEHEHEHEHDYEDTWKYIYSIGKVNVNVLPLPTSLSTQIRPPWASTSIRVM